MVCLIVNVKQKIISRTFSFYPPVVKALDELVEKWNKETTPVRAWNRSSLISELILRACGGKK
jgi:hypothetical protein